MFRRSGSFRGRSFSFRSRFRRPVARRRYLWVNQVSTVADMTATQRVVLINSALWGSNVSTGNMERARLEKLIIMPAVSGATTLVAQNIAFALYIDDVDASDPGNCRSVSFYDAAQPFHLGFLQLSPVTGGVTSLRETDNNFPDQMRNYTPKRKIRSDQVLWMSYEPPAVGAGTLGLNVFSRALISLD